ncbi:unnamed protein product [Spirodela intermedia]|uniref:Uncharacterized protein n=1 Tax=Spirodela intermedia TaxID=51605 RepID=A0A7I8K1J9_SPIIN|nr:unnamed protein product [Spirodela intermedia]
MNIVEFLSRKIDEELQLIYDQTCEMAMSYKFKKREILHCGHNLSGPWTILVKASKPRHYSGERDISKCKYLIGGKKVFVCSLFLAGHAKTWWQL